MSKFYVEDLGQNNMLIVLAAAVGYIALVQIGGGHVIFALLKEAVTSIIFILQLVGAFSDHAALKGLAYLTGLSTLLRGLIRFFRGSSG